MATKPLTTEAIALTEKKMDMSLDEIIKMSHKKTNKGKQQRRAPNKNQKVVNTNNPREKDLKVRQYMDSRSSLRQGFLARRRSSFQENQFPLAAGVAQKAFVSPIRARAFGGGRVASFNKPRDSEGTLQLYSRGVGARPGPAQRRSPNREFAAKPQQQHNNGEQHGKSVPKQKAQTLDSMFASMKEERTRLIPHKNNNVVQRNGGGGWRRPPWMRRFGN